MSNGQTKSVLVEDAIQRERAMNRPFFSAPVKTLDQFGVYLDPEQAPEYLAAKNSRVVFCGSASSRRAAFKAAMGLNKALWRKRKREGGMA